MFATQEQTMAAVRKHNRCEEKGKEWAKQCVRYESSAGDPVVTLIHPGGRAFPSEAPPLIARFFREVGPKKQ